MTTTIRTDIHGLRTVVKTTTEDNIITDYDWEGSNVIIRHINGEDFFMQFKPITVA